jgi:hypothetical protein
MDNNTARTAAQSMVDGRIVINTKNKYQSCINRLRKWYELHGKLFILPLQMEDVMTYFGSLIIPDPNKEKPPAFSSVQLHKSALVWYYKQQQIVIDPLLNEELEKFFKGFKRKVSDMKLRGEMNVMEGKHHLTFRGYCILAKKFLTLSPDANSNHNFNQMLFSWPFLILQWNLMARAGSVARIMLQHISWIDDSLVINIPKHKGDQDGAKAFPRHIYANPLEPSICPILSLAVNIFSKSYRFDPEEKQNYCLFDGGEQEKRFSRLLGKVLSELDENEVNQLYRNSFCKKRSSNLLFWNDLRSFSCTNIFTCWVEFGNCTR